MLELAMAFTAGILAAFFIALAALAPLKRMVKDKAKQEIWAKIPHTEAEIKAREDQLRASHAVELTALQTKLEKAQTSTAKITMSQLAMPEPETKKDDKARMPHITENLPLLPRLPTDAKTLTEEKLQHIREEITAFAADVAAHTAKLEGDTSKIHKLVQKTDEPENSELQSLATLIKTRIEKQAS